MSSKCGKKNKRGQSFQVSETCCVHNSIAEDTKNKIKELDQTMETMNNSVSKLQNFMERTKIEGEKMMAKMKEEKLKALIMIGKVQWSMAETETALAANEMKLKQLGVEIPTRKVSNDSSSTGSSVSDTGKESSDWLIQKFDEIMNEDIKIDEDTLPYATPISLEPVLCRDTTGLLKGGWEALQESHRMVNQLYNELLDIQKESESMDSQIAKNQ